MNSALSPREIQARIRSGASLAEVAEEAGVDESAIDGFAGPVIAEREFMATSALKSAIRRRGEPSHRRLGELVAERLQHRGIDAETITWDAWRQEDLRWRVVGTLLSDVGERKSEFIFDHRARFSIAANADARWMIGEQLPDAKQEEENTVDFNDELALIRATAEERTALKDAPGDDIPNADVMHDEVEDTSSLDALYDMLSSISEDSVRIYTGLTGDIPEVAETITDYEEPEPDSEPNASAAVSSKDTKDVEQGLLIDADEPEPKSQPKPKGRARKSRAHVPSWDEIMFGGGTKK